MPTLDSTVRNACADAAVGTLDGGTGAGRLQIWSGAAPATPATAPGGTMLAEITLNDPSFGAAVNGVASLDLTGGLSDVADATGTAGFARLVNGDGAGKLDMSVSATGGGGEVQLASLSIAAGVTVEVTSGTVTQPAS